MDSTKKPTYQELENQIHKLEVLHKENSLRSDVFRNSILSNMSHPHIVIELIYDAAQNPFDFYIRDVNSAFEKVVSKTREELLGKRVKEVFLVINDDWMYLSHEVIKTGVPKNFEKYEAEFDKYFQFYVWKAQEDSVAIIFHDISEKKRVEEKLNKEKKEAQTNFFDALSEMVEIVELIYDEDGKPIDFYIRDINQTFADFFGKSKTQLINKKISSIFETIQESWLSNFANVLKTGLPITFDGHSAEHDEYYSITAWKFSKDRVGVSYQDITKHKKSEKHKEVLKLKLKEIIRTNKKTQQLANFGSWMFVPETQKINFSSEMYTIWGFDPVKGTPKYEDVIKQVHPDDLDIVTSTIDKAIDSITSFTIEFRIYTPEGELKIIKSTIESTFNTEDKVMILQGVDQDITAQKIFERDLVTHERLKAIGEMSSSIAHDFNNSLQAMVGNMEVIKLQKELSDSTQIGLQNIESIISDIAGRVVALQKFGNIAYADSSVELIDFNELIENSLKQTRPLWKDRKEKEGWSITIQSDFKEIPKIRCNRGELKTAVYNLIKNSIEAMPEGGKLSIRTGVKKAGIFATFSDSGIGMTEENKEKVFEPFFSTKGFELGRGLGMSGAYRIINRHQGDIRVLSSEVGKGTTFEIVFPFVKQEVAQPMVIDQSKSNDSLNVLWVDDDMIITKLVDTLVKSIGHKITVANSGKMGLTHLENNPCDIVFTDLGMPEMNGWELIDAIRKKFGDAIKIIVVTGWEVEESVKKEKGIDIVLQKPFSLEMLKKAFSNI
tara:strand:- start:2986 stop:5322 length:2337 start_codon:yes stop_codon:yes gene_type:complete